MTSHAQRRRRKLATQLKVSNRTAANITQARTAERRGEGGAGTPSALTVTLPSPSIRHFYLAEETDYEVTVSADMQVVAHFTTGGGPLTNDGLKDRKFGWFSSWDTYVGPTRAGWVVDEGSWSPEWEPTERDLHDLAEKAMTNLAERAKAEALVRRLKFVLVIHGPRKLAILASDRPLPHGDLPTAMTALPRQPISEGPRPAWWPDGTGRPTIKQPEPRPIDEAQEEAFGDLVVALQRADGQVSIAMSKGALGIDMGTASKRAAIGAARAALARVQDAAVTPRQKRLAERALGHEARWKRDEESLTRIEAMDRGVFLPIR